MPYEAPEIVTLGEATAVIRSSGTKSSEGGCGCDKFLFVPFELADDE